MLKQAQVNGLDKSIFLIINILIRGNYRNNQIEK